MTSKQKGQFGKNANDNCEIKILRMRQKIRMNYKSGSNERREGIVFQKIKIIKRNTNKKIRAEA